ncbi:hypothetical protein HDF12_002753 [Edaphobacter lichenicola]|uniref:Uncharacterized protein n=1 Tax=Tunturiibacter lichenicola TaxID=2051959 RepID=A0A7Y9NN02_9BACT|nr:hypothetical protein [Edaphobacter lichenicola]
MSVLASVEHMHPPMAVWAKRDGVLYRVVAARAT